MTTSTAEKPGSSIVKANDAKSLEVECQTIYGKYVVPGYQQVTEGYWRIGRKFIKYEAEGWIKRSHGEATVKRIAEKLGVNYTYMYAAIELASRFNSLSSMRRMLKEREQMSMSISWSAIRHQVLPKNVGIGKGNQQHELMREGEHLAERLERVTGQISQLQSHSTGEDAEIAQNVRQALSDSLSDARETLAHAKPHRERQRAYIDFCKAHPKWCCIFTGDVEADPHHLKDKSLLGSDFDLVPMARELHDDVETPGFWTKDRLVSLLNWGRTLAEIDLLWLKDHEKD